MLKFEYGYNNTYIDVSKNIDYTNGIVKMGDYPYNSRFTDPVPGKIKSLKVTGLIDKPIHIKEESSFSLQLKEQSIDYPINIVYFMNIHVTDSYKYMLQSQLQQLKETGILDVPRVALHVIVSGPILYHMDVKDKIREIIPNCNIKCIVDNNYEYYGIKKVWDIGQESSEGVTLYFHSKGISHIKNPSYMNCRTNDEKYIFQNVIGNWRNHLKILSQFTSINKLGMGSGGIGWIWFNYWWIKNKYLHKCEKPILTKRRHYYEGWSARYVGDYLSPICDRERDCKVYPTNDDDCFNICMNTINSHYNIGTKLVPGEICSYINDGMKKCNSL